MKITIDTAPLKNANQYRGVGVYTDNLIKALRRVDDNNEYYLSSDPKSSEADLIHYPYFDFFFLTLPLYKKVPTIVTIHDTIPLIFPHQYPPGLRGDIKYYIQYMSLRGVRAVVTDSENSKADIVRLLNVPEGKVHRVYLAASDQITRLSNVEVRKTLQKFNVKKPYLLFVGDINYNKNVSGLLEAYKKYSESINLVMVSRAMREDSVESRSIIELIERLGIKRQVKILTDISMEPLDEMRAIYSGAEWYIQPSLYEGFGLPVLEAMQCEVPVISSIGGSLKEVVKDSAIIFDPKDKGAMEKAINNAMSMSAGEREMLVKQGIRNAKRFSWEKTAISMVEIYEKTYSK